MAIILIVSVILYVMSVVMINTNLYAFEKNEKIKFIVYGLISVCILTVILVTIASSGIKIENTSYLKTTKLTSILIFSPINSIMILPYVANAQNKYKQKILKDVQMKKRMIIFAVVVIIGAIIESGYITNFELGLLQSVIK